MDDFAKMNEIYMTYWGDVKPCRTYVSVLFLAALAAALVTGLFC